MDPISGPVLKFFLWLQRKKTVKIPPKCRECIPISYTAETVCVIILPCYDGGKTQLLRGKG